MREYKGETIFERDTSKEALAVADLRALLAAPLPVRSVRESLLRRALEVLGGERKAGST